MELGDYIMTTTLLGSGTFGSVYLGRKKNNPSHEVAIKEFKKESAFLEELTIAEAMAGPRDCTPYFVCFEKAYKKGGKYYIVYKKAWGNLDEWMHKKEGDGYSKPLNARNKFDQKYMNNVTDKERFKFITSMLTALAELHNNSISHRDIKPDNILVYKDGDEWEFTLGDLGSLCIDPSKKGKYNISSAYQCKVPSLNRTTLWYIPNTMKRRQVNYFTNVNYETMDENFLVDISAMGCVLYTFLTGMTSCHPSANFVKLDYPNDIVYGDKIIKKETISKLVNNMIKADSFDKFKKSPCSI